MDIVKEIEKQIESIKSEETASYPNQILIHLKRAEHYYIQGQNDQHFFNDVVYRSNQAYEGALKEAYKILANKSDEKLSEISLYKIEEYLRLQHVFNDRVLSLFNNYRQEWRNASTCLFR